MKKKYTYKVFHPGSSSPYFQDTSLWAVLRDIAYGFKEGRYSTFTITKEKN